MKAHSHLLIEPLETRIAPAAIATLNLSTLNGTNGFKIQGEAAYDGSGYSSSMAGDVNGDGFADVIIGAYTADPNGTSSGASYVVFGKAGPSNTPLNLSSVDGTNGFKILGEAADDRSGISVSAAGDVNGDGFADLLIGADQFAIIGSGAGASYVVFGKAGGFARTFNLSTVDGTNGFKIQGEAAPDGSGHSVSGAGDVNGDGFDDVIIGARRNSSPPGGVNSGAIYVVFGKAGGFATPVNLATLNSVSGFKIQGETDQDGFGNSVSAAGDVNGDGFADVIIGANLSDANGPHSGASYVVFGKSSFATPPTLSALNGSNGFTIPGEQDWVYSGRSVGAAGDLNGDGFDDILIGAPRDDKYSRPSPGECYVIFGKGESFTTPLNLATLNGTDGFKIVGEAQDDRAAHSLSSAGDVNGDGFDDVIIGAFLVDGAGINRGASYVIFGKTGGFTTPMSLSTLDGINGFKIEGAADQDVSGSSVSGTGDVNGDGLADLIIGAKGASPNGIASGVSYVIFGSAAFGTSVSFSKDHKTGTFTDQNANLVTVKITKGQLAPSNFLFASNGALERLDLTATQLVHNGSASFRGPTVQNGSGLSITAKSVGSALPAEVAMGAIDAHGLDLGAVTVAGTIEQIDAGDTDIKTAGIKSLTVNNFAAGATVVQYQPAGTPEPYHTTIVGALGSLTVKADLNYAVIDVTGGTFGKIGKVTVGNTMYGRDLAGTELALIRASGNIGAVSVKIGIFGGDGLTGILAGGTLGAVNLGALVSDDLAHPVILSALGKLGATTAAAARAIASVTVRTDVTDARILAGYTLGGGALNPDAGIGAISVGGDWSASSVAAGAKDTTGLGFGRSDVLIGGDTTPTLLAAIAGITIKGTAIGSPTPAFDFFGFVAQKIGKVGIRMATVVPTGPSTLLDSVNNDFRLVTL